MLAPVIRYACTHWRLVLIVAAAVTLLGVRALFDLRRDVFPDLSTPVFNVIVQNATMSPEELEVSVAIPLELALAGLPELRRLRSASQLGVTQVTAEFEPQADFHRSRMLLAERLGSVTPQLPAGTEAPLISNLTNRLNEIIEIAVVPDSDRVDLMALRDYADFELRTRLLAVPGVAAVEVIGGFLRQFQVLLDPDKMAIRGISLNEIRHALEGANLNAAAGFFAQGPIEWNVRAAGRIESTEDLRRTVVALRGATPVVVGDIADVREGPAIRRGVAHRFDTEVVQCRVIKQYGADTAQVAAGVHAALQSLRAAEPEGLRVEVVYDQTQLIDSALGGVARAVLIGAALVMIVLAVLLGNLRGAVVVSLTIPVSLALAALGLQFLGVGLNTMTLGGLAIAIGLLVDASIIVVENVIHRRSGASSAGRDVTLVPNAAAEMARPITFATAIIITVFLPLLSLSGVEGRMYQPLAAAVVAAMAASLVLALTLTPAVADLLLGRRAPTEDTWIIRRIKIAYAPILDFCLRHAGRVRLLTLAVTVPALLLALRLGADFIPQLDEGALMLQTSVPAEASLGEVDRLNHSVEDTLRQVPEIRDVFRRTGRAERTEDPMPHTLSDVLVVLDPNRSRSLQEIEDDVRDRVASVHGVTSLLTTPLAMRIDEGLGGTPADLAIRIFGPDLQQLAKLAEQAQEAIEDIDGIADLRADATGGLPQVRIVVDREAASRVGLTPGDIIEAVRIGLVGEEISTVWLGQRRYDLVVKLQENRRSDIPSLEQLLIDGHDGTRVPLRQVARLDATTGPAAIRREAGSRRIAVEATIAGRDLTSTANAVRERLAESLTLPTGYFIDVGGRVDSQRRATSALMIAGLTAALAVFALLVFALGSVAEALVILATLPDAMVGGVLALWLSGETWNVSSLVGLIGLIGIAVQNGLVLVSQTRGLVAQGLPFPRALREASLGRVRPKLLTAATAILGLLPLLVLPLHGTEIERPLAIVMVGGLLTSTLFTLLALPTFYSLVNDLRQR